MADKKITQLPSASIATGSNVLPIIQEGATEQITVTNLGQGILNLGLPVTASTVTVSEFVQTNIVQGTGSLILIPDLNDSRSFEIYNTAPSDVHIKGNAGLTYFGDDTNYLKVDTSINTVTVAAFGDIILDSDDGSIYLNSVTGGNEVASQGWVNGIVGDTSIINNSTGHTITDVIFNIGKYATTGSNIFIGDQTVSGSLLTSGSINVGGNIIPSVSKSFSLGSVNFPFRDIFISSGSLNIASDTPGAPNTILSNVDGNILISSGGMQLLGSGSFNASTGSFQYISGSMKQVGNYTQIGDHQTTGSVSITGSGFLNGEAILTSANTGSFYSTGSFGFYGNFYSTQSQTNPVSNVSQSLPLETNAGSDGVSVVSGSRLTVANPGVYNLQFSTQFEKSSNGTDIVYIWFKKNGVNIDNSATALDITKQAGGGGKIVAAWNYIDQLVANDYLEIVWQSDDTTVSAYATAASGNIPAIPSTIATLTQVS